MSLEAEGFYEFGGFRLSPAARRLQRGARAVSLPPKAFEALLALVESGGRVMGRGELIQRIWPAGEAGEANLAVMISALRKTLGERPDGGLYIETVPRQGYRFAAPVQAGANSEVPTGAATTGGPEESAINAAAQNGPTSEAALPPTPTIAPPGADRAAPGGDHAAPAVTAQAAGAGAGGRGLRRKTLFIAAALVLIAVAAGYVMLSRPTAKANAQPRRLAILPFRNLNPNAATDFLGSSLADSITTKLGGIRSLIVRPSAYVKKYAGANIDPKRAAAELNVDTLMTGTYLKEGDTLRITVQLIDANKGEILARLPLDTRYDKLPAVHEQVAASIVDRLQMKLSFDESEALKQKGTENRQAYELYLQGRDLYLNNNFMAAVPLLEEAVRLDPNFALAWAHLGRARNAAASFKLRGRDLHLSAQAAYDQALNLNPDLTEAVIFKANLFTDTNRVEQSVPLLRRLLTANPNHAEAHWELGYAYRFAGMLAESVEEGERARALDPLVKAGSSAFNSYLYTGQYEKFLASLPASDDNAFLIFYRGLGNYYMKNWERAAAEFDRAYETEPQLYTQIGKALSYAIHNQLAAGLDLLRNVEHGIEQSGVGDAEGIYKVAQAYAALGDRASALRVLRHSIEQGFFCYAFFMSDPLLTPLRGEAEFAALMEKARARQEQFRQAFF
ncbi:MAG TPA: winged helix-turn-helix domain-containing protein [Blastocatellia bacterium]|nr:winged helix-turn-helix domain-containing protein [Blastocatellia bacterium]